MTPFFHLLFPLWLFVTFIFAFETSQNSLSCGPHFGRFWSVKYLSFGQKLPMRATHHTFLESRHPEVTKNSYYALPPKGSQKRFQLMDYIHFNEAKWLMTMKVRLKVRNELHIYDTNRPRPKHGHKFTKYKMCLRIMMLICIKQHLRNIWSSVYEKVK